VPVTADAAVPQGGVDRGPRRQTVATLGGQVDMYVRRGFQKRKIRGVLDVAIRSQFNQTHKQRDFDRQEPGLTASIGAFRAEEKWEKGDVEKLRERKGGEKNQTALQGRRGCAKKCQTGTGMKS